MEFWDTLGYWLMIAGAVIGCLALLTALASSVILYRVTKTQQEQIEQESRAHTERTAHLEHETALARLETERIKKEVSWRVVDADMRRKLITGLLAKPSVVTLVYLPGDAEATEYCAQFVDVFKLAGWKVQVVGRTFLGPPVGVTVTQNDVWNPNIQAEIEWLRDILESAGVVVDKSGGAVDSRSPALSLGEATAPVRVVIGHRPSPKLE